MASARALIIGATGLLGGALLRLLTREARVSVMNRTVDPHFSGAQHPLADLEVLDAAFDVVYLLAAHIPYGCMETFSPALREANVELACRVARKFAASRIIYSSTVSVYGAPIVLPIAEDHPFNNPSAYATSKLAGEVAVRACPNHAILRFSSLYGPHMKVNTFISAIIGDARVHGRITLHGSGSRTQDYLFVDDAAAMMAAAGRAKSIGIFNAVAGHPSTNLQVAQAVATAIGNVEIVHQGDDVSPSVAYSRARWNSEFGGLPAIELRTGIARTVCGG